jgi:hypothetical protein
MKQENIKLISGRKYLFTWKGIYGNLHEYEGTFKRIENNEYIFEVLGMGELPFETKEIIKVEEI